MKLNTQSKKEFTNNHRVNYQIQNKSHIFDNETADNTTTWKSLSLASIRQKHFPSFAPKFKDQYVTAHARKLKQFWKKDEYVAEFSKHGGSLGFFEREALNNPTVRPTNVLMTPKNRKILELFPNMKIEECPVKQRSLSTKHLPEQSSLIKSAKILKAESLWSNIFNDPSKEDLIISDRSAPKENKTLKIQTIQHQHHPKSKLPTHFTWLKFNTELAENKINNSQDEQSYSSKKMKMESMLSHFDSDEKKKLVLEYSSHARRPLSVAARSEKGNIEAKNRLMFNLSSSMDRGYPTSAKEKGSEAFEIERKSGFDRFGWQEIKSLFTTKGMHVYNLEETGKLIDGFNSGKISFKIRKSQDEMVYQQNISEIFKNLMMCGMNIKKVETCTQKPLTELIPTTLGWKEGFLSTNTEKRLKCEERSQQIANEKLASRSLVNLIPRKE